MKPEPIHVPDRLLADLRRRLELTDQRVQHFLGSDRAAWYNHVNLTAHDHGGHFIPWEIPAQWVDDLRRTFRGYR